MIKNKIDIPYLEYQKYNLKINECKLLNLATEIIFISMRDILLSYKV